MGDHSMNDSKGEESTNVASDAAALEAATSVTTKGTSITTTRNFTHGVHSYDDADYASETETDKPILLEIGTKSKAPPISIPTAIYAKDYPLDMHITTSHLYRPIALPEFQPLSSTHLSLYNNPFTSHLQQQRCQLPSATTITPIDVGNNAPIASFASLIPHPVCTWPSGEAERKASPDVVPPAMCMSYGMDNTAEHIISKESNPVWKDKALQIEKDYKKTACDRERTRMRDMNRAFDLLRSKLPISKPNGKKYSKIESLRIAINYINHLQQCLRDEPPDFKITPFSTNSMNYEVDHPSQSTIDYVIDSEERRYQETYPYDLRNRSYQLEMERVSDEHNRSSWSDVSYVPNDNDWD